MSIYATVAEMAIRQFGDEEFTELVIQSVPPHIDDTGPEWDFLPPPVDPDGTTPRAVVIVLGDCQKGTARCGQEYVDPLVVLSGREWEETPFPDLLIRIEAALDSRRIEPRPFAIFIGPDGVKKKLHRREP